MYLWQTNKNEMKNWLKPVELAISSLGEFYSMFFAKKRHPFRAWLWLGAIVMIFAVTTSATDAQADQATGKTNMPVKSESSDDGSSNNWFTDLFGIKAEETKAEKTVESEEETENPKTAAKDEAPKDKEDPLEGYNRFMHGFNKVIRDAILDPLVDGYQAITPDPLEKAIANVAKNLNEPITAGSSLLQGDTENAKKATQRFLINTTVGLGGAKDVAKDEYGIKSRDEDLGQAAGKGGAEAGAHIVLPILGPSNTRDALGTAATAVINPFGAIGSAAKGVVEYSDRQDTLKDVSKGALDPYVVERDAYEQHRDYQIRNAAPAAKEQDFPGLSEEPAK
jgi:phospholipid-binding lipoprotein MlaA